MIKAKAEPSKAKIDRFFSTKTLQIANLDGEIIMNTGKEDEAILFGRNGLHYYLTRDELEWRLRQRIKDESDIDYIDIMKGQF